MSRALKRERAQASPDYKELCRRFLADSEDFSKTRLDDKKISDVFINENLEKCIRIIKKYILDFDKNDAEI